MTEIIPAILPENFPALEEAVARVASYVKRVQVDIVDGAFAPAKTWPFQSDRGELKELTTEQRGLPHWEDVEYEIDMMVLKPEEKMDNWITAGASALIIHRESVTDEVFHGMLVRAETRGIDIGMAFKPSTDFATLEQWIPRLAFVQCMGSDTIGYHGITLDQRVAPLVARIREAYPGLSIAVDIGVNEDTAPTLVKAGATKLVIGSALMNTLDVSSEIRWFKDLS